MSTFRIIEIIVPLEAVLKFFSFLMTENHQKLPLCKPFNESIWSLWYQSCKNFGPFPEKPRKMVGFHGWLVVNDDFSESASVSDLGDSVLEVLWEILWQHGLDGWIGGQEKQFTKSPCFYLYMYLGRNLFQAPFFNFHQGL